MTQTPNPDAAVIALCAEHEETRAAACASDSEDLNDPIWLAYDRTRDAISAARPETMAGVIAKIRAAKGEARMPDGTESTENYPVPDWASQIMNDILRLNPQIDSQGNSALNLDPEADVIATCRRFLITRKAYDDSPPDLDSDENPLWPAYEKAWNAVDEVEPTTLPGLIAMAKVVVCEVGKALEMDEKPATWALRIVRKLALIDVNRANGAELNRHPEPDIEPGNFFKVMCEIIFRLDSAAIKNKRRAKLKGAA